MSKASQEALERLYRGIEIMSRGLQQIASGVYSAEQAQTIASAALFEVSELHNDTDQNKTQ